jgi:3-dehydroquinate dehydratase / shikimate dehydrogenase
MNQGKICVSVCGKTASDVLDKVGRASSDADIVELRFDCLAPKEIPTLFDNLAGFQKPLLITFRPREQGGHRNLTIEERRQFWTALPERVNGADIIGVDKEADLQIADTLDAEHSIVSWHDFKGSPSNLSETIERLCSAGRRTIKIAVSITSAEQGVDVWKLLSSTTAPSIPIAMGEAGKWTRVLGLAHGAPMTYASLDEDGKTAPGQISARDLRNVFRVKELDKETNVFGVIATDSSYSLSPFMHNLAFKTAGLNAVFLPLQTKDLDAFMRRMVMSDTREVELNFKGFSVTNPHKQAVMRYLDEVDESAANIGAINTVKVENGKLLGYNTDAPGFIHPLKNLYGDLNGASAIVVGAGGAARACIYALKCEGVDVTVMARDRSKASILADEFSIRCDDPPTDHRSLTTDILVNATPLGTRGEREGDAIATADELGSIKLVYDLVYNPAETRLLCNAREAGADTLGGIEMLIAQGARQFEIWTGGDAPVEVMKTAIEERLK